MWYIYTMECYSAIKRNEVMPFAATWIALEIIILSEEKDRDRERQVLYHLYMEYKKMIQMKLFT